MPQIEVQVRLPTTKGIWRWYEYLDDGEDLAELLRRVVKYDARAGATVKSSETLWLRAFELRAKLVARFDPAAGCYRPVRRGNPWVGCYDRAERLEALEDKRAFLHRRFLNARRESKVGYTEADRAAGARERDELQRQLDANAAEAAAINAEDPRAARPPLFPARTLAEAGFADKCIVYVEHRGVVCFNCDEEEQAEEEGEEEEEEGAGMTTPTTTTTTTTMPAQTGNADSAEEKMNAQKSKKTGREGYLLPDLADFRKDSMDALRAVIVEVRVSADADALEKALAECIAMGMGKTDALALEANKVLAVASKIQGFRLDALATLRSLMRRQQQQQQQQSQQNHQEERSGDRSPGGGGGDDDGYGDGGGGAYFYNVSEAVEHARQAGVAAEHPDLVAASALLARLQVAETERLRVAAEKQAELDDLVDYCALNKLSEAIAAHVQACGFSLDTMHSLTETQIKQGFKGVPFADKKRFATLVKQLARNRRAAEAEAETEAE